MNSRASLTASGIDENGNMLCCLQRSLHIPGGETLLPQEMRASGLGSPETTLLCVAAGLSAGLSPVVFSDKKLLNTP